jgi:hypothetical protein
MNPWWLLLLWPLSGQLVWLRWRDRAHPSWFASWDRRLGLAVVVLYLIVGTAFLGPLALGLKTFGLEDDGP